MDANKRRRLIRCVSRSLRRVRALVRSGRIRDYRQLEGAEAYLIATLDLLKQRDGELPSSLAEVEEGEKFHWN